MKQITKTFAMAFLLIAFSLRSQTYKIYMGLLHAHSSISDGSGTPEEAFLMAKQTGLDFFALTEHNHLEADGKGDRKDGILIAKDNKLYNGSTTLTVTTTAGKKVVIKPLIKAAKDATTTKFLALYGQEFSTISSGNHVNLVGIDEVIKCENGNYKELVEMLDKMKTDGKKLPIMQMNHPDVYADLFANNPDKNAFNDYGIDEDDLGPHFKNLIARLDPYVSLIEVLSGPALTKNIKPNYHYDETYESDYFFYLKQGFHISPSAGQDNHYYNWGKGTDARVGVLATTLTEKDIFDGINNNRTFATDDKNLTAYFSANKNIMGLSITANEDSEIDIELVINDKDEATSEYSIKVYGGSIKPELSTNATSTKLKDGLLLETEVTGNGTFKIKGVNVPDGPAFIYIKIVQDDGGRLWTAPVWINYNTTTGNVTSGGSEIYYWSASKSSKVYHKKGCSSVNMINSENLQEGTTPPEGRTLHECNNQSEDH
ncbi:MAG: CehA/McbA family metallohydrolase [Bacteroidetes bacterium]|nr:CehA/McbA family metallohydrolase [Bacteroidota bacterium]